MATRTDCVIYLNWWEFLKKVADGAGIAIPSGIVSQISQAREYFETRRYEEAYSMSSAAVRDFRAILKGQKEQLTARCDALIGSITGTMSSAQGQGIDTSAFVPPFNRTMSMYNARDYIASFHTLSNLLDDLLRYVSNARLGKWVDPLTGTYNIPEGTTDIITVEVFQPESAGWSYIDPGVVQEQVDALVKQVGGERVLEVRYAHPRLIIFAKGSPLIPIIIAAIAVVLAAFLLVVIALFWWQPYVVATKTAEVEKHKADLTVDYSKHISDMVAAGELSPEVAQQLLNEFQDQMKDIKFPKEWGITDYITLGIGVVIIGGVLYFTVPLIRGAFRKEGKKK